MQTVWGMSIVAVKAVWATCSFPVLPSETRRAVSIDFEYFLENSGVLIVEGPAGRCKRDIAGGAFKQREIQQMLQLLDAPG